MRASQGEIARWFVTCTDVETFKRAESELQNAIKLREDFLSIAGHELKTPLTALQLQVDGVGRLAAARAAETNIGAKVLQRLEKASAHLRRVNRMVEDLLDVSRIKAGRLQLEKEEFDLAEMAREVIARYSETATKQGCKIEFRDTDHPIGQWDRDRLEQVLTNLLSNAIKYGSEKPIEIEVSVQNGWAVLKVRDHGIGIPPEDQQRIFERFERAVSEHRFGGFGLGLWIAKRITEACGGEILLESAAGQGATFSVVLPLQPPGSVSQPFVVQTRA
jgi:signal transduction histidine kinase